MRGEFIDVGGVRLYYFAAGTRGAGEPIVLLHGFPTSSHLWSDLVPLLPDGHRVVVVDLLGYGRSDSPIAHDLSIRGHARRVLSLMDALGIDVAALVGHDLGGGIAQALAVDYPNRVSRLCLCDSVAFDAWPSREARFVRTVAPLTSHVPPEWIASLVKRDLIRGYVAPDRGSHSLDQYLRPFSRADGRDALLLHLAAQNATETSALEPQLRALSVPTSIVWGKDDPFLACELGERLAATIPHATLDYIPDVRHFVPEEAPERLSQVIAQLMRR